MHDWTGRRAERGTADVGQAVTGKRKGETEQASYRFWGLVKAVHRLAAQDRSLEATLAKEMFQTAQWAQGSEAAASLAQMAARGAKGDARLAALVRERQDLVAEWQKRDGVRSAAVSQAPDKRDRAAEAANVARLAAIDTRIAEIDKRLAAEFPDYAALADPTPLSVEEVQAQLGADEALVLFLDTPEWKPTPEETFIWVVTKTDMRWVRIDLGTPALTREVAALRCGLDEALWEMTTAQPSARDLVKTHRHDATIDGNVRQVCRSTLARAHALYKALFGQVEDLIRDKHLLIVPSGPLTQLPFQVLVTAPRPPAANYRVRRVARAQARHHRAARRLLAEGAAPRRQAQRGDQADDRLRQSAARWRSSRAAVGSRQWATLARQKQACPQTPWQQRGRPARPPPGCRADGNAQRPSRSRPAAGAGSRCPTRPMSCARWPRI